MSELKEKVAKAALDYIDDNMIVGVGTGSTVNYFIMRFIVFVKLNFKIGMITRFTFGIVCLKTFFFIYSTFFPFSCYMQ